MKKLFLLIALVALLQTAWSQTANVGSTTTTLATIFSHYHLNPVLINPAYAGFTGDHHINMNIRSQWTGFPESPKSYRIGYNGPIGKTLGVGANLMSENVGNLSVLRFQLNYAFRYQINDVKLAAGFSTDFYTTTLAESVMSSPLYEIGDPIVQDAVSGNKIFDAALGFWSSFKDRTFIGLTFSNLVVAKIGDIESGSPEGSLFRYVVLNFGHVFDIEPYNFTLEPSLMVQRIKDKPFQADFNLKGSFIDDKLIAGVSYRAGLGGAVGLLLGTNIDVFKLYYSYDV
ncbi:MAG: PorP/SprF family type IX secretion system membrane protein, partial [Saprospiraceae bacterium]